jgi:hypothetical protein
MYSLMVASQIPKKKLDLSLNVNISCVQQIYIWFGVLVLQQNGTNQVKVINNMRPRANIKQCMLFVAIQETHE